MCRQWHAKQQHVMLSTTNTHLMLLQGVNAALQRAKEAADAAAAAESLRYAQLQATKLQDAAHWQQQLDQVGYPSSNLGM